MNSGAALDGAVITAPNDWCYQCQIAVGGLLETVAYGGAAPGLIDGVIQINFLVPNSVYEYMGQAGLNFNGVPVNGFFYVSE
jgi:uncharacterized protein (TIGR03437 family)